MRHPIHRQIELRVGFEGKGEMTFTHSINLPSFVANPVEEFVRAGESFMGWVAEKSGHTGQDLQYIMEVLLPMLQAEFEEVAMLIKTGVITEFYFETPAFEDEDEGDTP